MSSKRAPSAAKASRLMPPCREPSSPSVKGRIDTAIHRDGDLVAHGIDAVVVPDGADGQVGTGQVLSA